MEESSALWSRMRPDPASTGTMASLSFARLQPVACHSSMVSLPTPPPTGWKHKEVSAALCSRRRLGRSANGGGEGGGGEGGGDGGGGEGGRTGGGGEGGGGEGGGGEGGGGEGDGQSCLTTVVPAKRKLRPVSMYGSTLNSISMQDTLAKVNSTARFF